jgi:hypothetical protein
LIFKPKIELNQFLLNPTNPKTFATNINKKQKVKENSNKPENNKNSTENLTVPGKPEKQINIIITEIARFGQTNNIPFIDTTDLV